jgi:hypothetical protein
MRLSDAGLRQHQTKALYANHRLPPWPNEDAALRSLEPIVRACAHRHTPSRTSYGPHASFFQIITQSSQAAAKEIVIIAEKVSAEKSNGPMTEKSILKDMTVMAMAETMNASVAFLSRPESTARESTHEIP